MKVRRAELFLIRLPLRLTVRHALAARRESLNLVVRLCDEQGNEGWGEGVPRDYVTGEDAESSFEHLAAVLLPSLAGTVVEGPDQLLPAVARLLSPAPGNQTCCCAAELALFDLAGKAFNRSAASWFGGRRRESVRYSVVLPLLEPAEMPGFLARVRGLGVTHLKIKAEGDRWPEALAEARKALGDGVTIAVDANGSWDLDAAVGHLREMERYRVAWVEQPLPRGREHEIPLLAGSSAIPLMADESLTTVEEALQLVRQARLPHLQPSSLQARRAGRNPSNCADCRGRTACGYRSAARSASPRCSPPPAVSSRRPCPESKRSRARTGPGSWKAT